MLLDEAESLTDFASGKTRMLGKFNSRLKPELGLTVLPLNMHMQSRLLPREEVEAEAAFPNAHGTERHPQRMKHAKNELKARPPSPLTGGF